ncbi:gamma-aminobutyric acid receptor subunit beta-like [Tubulanus polymorphus]|uniref:gamma-aminobutyric acid receptor subunit beta-like n=1 Tax=Tubulanus polymorphus TaxID=672921 RepID=UPI003DA305A9
MDTNTLAKFWILIVTFWMYGQLSATASAEKTYKGMVRIDSIAKDAENESNDGHDSQTVDFPYANIRPQDVHRQQKYYAEESTKNISLLLDKFLLGYDKRLRPHFKGPPVEIGVSMWVQGVSSISEVDMDVTIDIYFRQMWLDPRLKFEGFDEELSISADMLEKIWLPDTFFANAKTARFHTATTKNIFLRIDPEGNVFNSIRLTVTSSCPMDLTYFPMDSQKCTLEVESFGYKTKDIKYYWVRRSDAVGVDQDVQLPQFTVRGHKTVERVVNLSTGNYSRLSCEIFFERSMGYYLIQIYIPSTLIVVLSWVSFWLCRSAVPARVALGITTVLTMTTLISSTNASLPKISYLKSIDVYLVTCFVMVFASLLEYAAVSYIAKRCNTNTNCANKELLNRQKSRQEKLNNYSNINLSVNNLQHSATNQIRVPTSRTFGTVEEMHNSNGMVWRRKNSNPELRHFPTEIRLTTPQYNANACDLDPNPRSEKPRRRRVSCRECCVVRPSTIDKYSRVAFPLVFVCFNVLYWVTYVYLVKLFNEDEHRHHV